MPFNAEIAGLKAAGKNNDLFVGVFKPNGAGAIDQTQNVSLFSTSTGAKFTVTRANTGLYTVTIESEYSGLVALIPFGYNLGVRWVDAVTPPGPLGGSGSTAGKTFQLQAKDAAGAAADITAGTNVLVGFAAFLKSKGTVAGL